MRPAASWRRRVPSVTNGATGKTTRSGYGFVKKRADCSSRPAWPGRSTQEFARKPTSTTTSPRVVWFIRNPSREGRARKSQFGSSSGVSLTGSCHTCGTFLRRSAKLAFRVSCAGPIRRSTSNGRFPCRDEQTGRSTVEPPPDLGRSGAIGLTEPLANAEEINRNRSRLPSSSRSGARRW
jgi:hypothetical protein